MRLGYIGIAIYTILWAPLASTVLSVRVLHSLDSFAAQVQQLLIYLGWVEEQRGRIPHGSLHDLTVTLVLPSWLLVTLFNDLEGRGAQRRYLNLDHLLLLLAHDSATTTFFGVRIRWLLARWRCAWLLDLSDAIFHLLFPGLHFLLRNVDPRRILLAKERVGLYVILKLALRARAYNAIDGSELFNMGLHYCLLGVMI